MSWLEPIILRYNVLDHWEMDAEMLRWSSTPITSSQYLTVAHDRPQAVLLIRWVGGARDRTHELVVQRREPYRLSYPDRFVCPRIQSSANRVLLSKVTLDRRPIAGPHSKVRMDDEASVAASFAQHGKSRQSINVIFARIWNCNTALSVFYFNNNADLPAAVLVRCRSYLLFIAEIRFRARPPSSTDLIR